MLWVSLRKSKQIKKGIDDVEDKDIFSPKRPHYDTDMENALFLIIVLVTSRLSNYI